jgi:hypothetical protein
MRAPSLQQIQILITSSKNPHPPCRAPSPMRTARYQIHASFSFSGPACEDGRGHNCLRLSPSPVLRSRRRSRMGEGGRSPDEGPFVGTIADASNWGKEPSPALRAPSPIPLRCRYAGRERAIISEGFAFFRRDDKNFWHELLAKKDMCIRERTAREKAIISKTLAFARPKDGRSNHQKCLFEKLFAHAFSWHSGCHGV